MSTGIIPGGTAAPPIHGLGGPVPGGGIISGPIGGATKKRKLTKKKNTKKNDNNDPNPASSPSTIALSSPTTLLLSSSPIAKSRPLAKKAKIAKKPVAIKKESKSPPLESDPPTIASPFLDIFQQRRGQVIPVRDNKVPWVESTEIPPDVLQELQQLRVPSPPLSSISQKIILMVLV